MSIESGFVSHYESRFLNPLVNQRGGSEGRHGRAEDVRLSFGPNVAPWIRTLDKMSDSSHFFS